MIKSNHIILLLCFLLLSCGGNQSTPDISQGTTEGGSGNNADNLNPAPVAANALWDKLKPKDTRIFHRSASSNDHTLWLSADNSIWTKFEIYTPTNLETPFLNGVSWVFYSKPVPVTDASLTFQDKNGNPQGSWAASFATSVKSAIAGDTVSWRTSATENIVIYVYSTSNGSLARVYIDGDPKAANQLETALNVVEQGYYPQEILTTYGGILEPDDRVINTGRGARASHGDGEKAILAAVGLENTSHDVIYEATGYSNNQDPGASAYFAGYGYLEDPLTEAVNEHLHREGVAPLNSNLRVGFATWELAANFAAYDQGSFTWSGNTHGNVTLMEDLSVSNDNSSVQIEKLTRLSHPHDRSRYFAQLETGYRFSDEGFTLSLDLLWLEDVWVNTLYLGMQSFAESTINAIEQINLNRASSSVNDSAETLSGNNVIELDINEENTQRPNDINHSFGSDHYLYSWESEGNLIAAIKIEDNNALGSNEIFIADKSTGNAASFNSIINKWYIPLEFQAGHKLIPANTRHRQTLVYRFKFDKAGSQNTIILD